MSDPQTRPPSLPSSSYLPKIQIKTTSAQPLNPTQHATMSFYGTVPPHESPTGLRSRAGSVNTILSSRPGTLASNPRSTDSPDSTSRRPSVSHAGGILPPASFFRAGQARPAPITKHIAAMPFGPPKPNPRSPTKPSNLPRRPPIPQLDPVHADAVEDEGNVSPDEHLDSIQMDQLARPTSPVIAEENSASLFDDTTVSHGGYDTSIGPSGGPLSSRTKASREQLLPFSTEHSESGHAVSRIGGGRAVRGSLDRIFGRQSVESSRKSFDVEKTSSGNHDGREFLAPSHIVSPSYNFAPPSIYAPSASHASVSHVYPTGGLSTRRSSIVRPVQPPVLQNRVHVVVPPTTVVLNEKTGKPVRNHTTLPSRNYFFCQGRALTGGDSPFPFIATVTLIFGIAGTWFGCVAPYWWRHESVAVPIVAAYMTLLSISSLLMTVSTNALLFLTLRLVYANEFFRFTQALRDPGIIPRNLDPDPPFATSSPTDSGPPVPLQRDVRVRAGT